MYGQVDTDIKQFSRRIADDNNIEIIEVESDKGHIHLLVGCTPQHYIPSIIKAFKDASARLLFKKHPELKQLLWGGHLWSPNYFVATADENTGE